MQPQGIQVYQVLDCIVYDLLGPESLVEITASKRPLTQHLGFNSHASECEAEII